MGGLGQPGPILVGRDDDFELPARVEHGLGEELVCSVCREGGRGHGRSVRRSELVDQWRGCSLDKRTAPSPYFGRDGVPLEVGFYDPTLGVLEVSLHADAIEACVDFIYREAAWVLHGLRPPRQKPFRAKGRWLYLPISHADRVRPWMTAQATVRRAGAATA